MSSGKTKILQSSSTCLIHPRAAYHSKGILSMTTARSLRKACISQSSAHLTSVQNSKAQRPQLQTLYRRARLDEAEHILEIYKNNRKALLPKTKEEVEQWIRNEDIFVARTPGDFDNLIGMIQFYFVNSITSRMKVIEQFKLSKPLEVEHATIHIHKANFTSQEISSTPTGREYQLDVDRTALFYCGSLAVSRSAGDKTTAFRLIDYAILQQMPTLRMLKAQLEAESRKVRQIGLLFGTAPTNETIRRIGLRLWQRLLASIWDSPSVMSMSFAHTRPDGENAKGHLLLFEISHTVDVIQQ